MDEKALFTSFWNKEAESTRRVFERIPDGSDYRPDPKSRTARQIAWQIVCEQAAIMDALESGAMGWNPPKMPDSMSGVVDALDEQRSDLARRLEALPAERWDGTIDFMGTARPAAPLAWSFFFDIIHHRGQITTYLRPMGSTVPQVYGPSADEP